jgi:hypothetical protein
LARRGFLGGVTEDLLRFQNRNFMRIAFTGVSQTSGGNEEGGA